MSGTDGGSLGGTPVGTGLETGVENTGLDTGLETGLETPPGADPEADPAAPGGTAPTDASSQPQKPKRPWYKGGTTALALLLGVGYLFNNAMTERAIRINGEANQAAKAERERQAQRGLPGLQQRMRQLSSADDLQELESAGRTLGQDSTSFNYNRDLNNGSINVNVRFEPLTRQNIDASMSDTASSPTADLIRARGIANVRGWGAMNCFAASARMTGEVEVTTGTGLEITRTSRAVAEPAERVYAVCDGVESSAPTQEAMARGARPVARPGGR